MMIDRKDKTMSNCRYTFQPGDGACYRAGSTVTPVTVRAVTPRKIVATEDQWRANGRMFLPGDDGDEVTFTARRGEGDEIIFVLRGEKFGCLQPARRRAGVYD
jgi:hypothetical protein